MINKRLHVIVDELTPEMEKVSRRIFENPEVGLSEYKASKWLIGILEDNGFSVELGLGSMATAFRALWKGAEPGPNIAYLAEYDALPGVGHGCGHNLVGTGSVYAAIALSKVLPAGAGTITVLGTPAEEDKGGKIILLNEGFFDDVDMAIFAHPSSISQIGRGGRAITSVTIEYEGKQAHSANPSNGINALNAVIQTFNGLDAIFQTLPGDVSTNGIILEGGEADNIIPGYAACRFSIRGKTKADVETALAAVKSVVKSVEILTGAKAKCTDELVYAERYNNMVMENRYGEYLTEQGDSVTLANPVGRFGSSDIGNISLVMPAMHPYYRITDNENPPMAHTIEWADMCITERAYEGLRKNVISLAALGNDILTDEDFRKAISDEYHKIVLQRVL